MGSPIDRILRDCPHGACCCPHALESCWRLACQVDLAAVDHHGETALHLAIRGGSVDWFEASRILACARCACFLRDLYQLFVNCSVLSVSSVVDFLSNAATSESTGTCSSCRPWVPCFHEDRALSIKPSIHSCMNTYLISSCMVISTLMCRV